MIELEQRSVQETIQTLQEKGAIIAWGRDKSGQETPHEVILSQLRLNPKDRRPQTPVNPNA